jgi:regulator of protease activity HflC (stomatin/prohibitin superfamily)
MDDSDKGGGPSAPVAPPDQKPIGGLVIDPREVKTNPSLTKYLRERIGAAIVGTLVAIGIMRPRNANGELGRRHWKGLFTFLGVIIAVIIIWTSVHVVQPGNVAVPVTFGHAGEPLDPGIHITLPFTNAYSMSTRTQNYTMSSSKSDGPPGSVDSAVTVLGQDGGSATVNATLLYRVDRSKATDVYRNLGRNYGPSFVRPTARGCIRDAFTQYVIVDAASVKSGTIENDVATCVKAKLESAGLLLQAFQVRSVVLDPNVQTAVTAKVAAQQKLFQQAFDEATALKQAEIRRIAAQAVSDEESIVQCGGHLGTITVNGKKVQTIVPNAPDKCNGLGLTNAYLEYAYIQAINNLATSGKATVIVGTNGSPLPVIPVPAGSTGASGQ